MKPCWALEQGLAEQVALLQVEMERSKGSPKKAMVMSEVDSEFLLPQEPLCQQLMEGAGPGEEKARMLVDAEQLTPQVEEKVARPGRNTGGAILGCILNALIVALVFDGLLRWLRNRGDSEPALENWDSLMQVALAGNVAQFEALISKGISIVGSDLWGCTLLHAASRCGSLPIIQKLLEHGALVDQSDSWDDTPLHLAARAGNVDACELLLAHGAPIDTTNAQDWTPLVVAADAGHENVCNLLVARRAGVAGLEATEFPALLTLLLAETAPKQQDEEGLMAASEEEFSPLEEDISDEAF